jgi:hypothetical protein
LAKGLNITVRGAQGRNNLFVELSSQGPSPTPTTREYKQCEAKDINFSQDGREFTRATSSNNEQKEEEAGRRDAFGRRRTIGTLGRAILGSNESGDRGDVVAADGECVAGRGEAVSGRVETGGRTPEPTACREPGQWLECGPWTRKVPTEVTTKNRGTQSTRPSPPYDIIIIKYYVKKGKNKKQGNKTDTPSTVPQQFDYLVP